MKIKLNVEVGNPNVLIHAAVKKTKDIGAFGASAGLDHTWSSLIRQKSVNESEVETLRLAI